MDSPGTSLKEILTEAGTREMENPGELSHWENVKEEEEERPVLCVCVRGSACAAAMPMCYSPQPFSTWGPAMQTDLSIFGGRSEGEGSWALSEVWQLEGRS